MSNIFLNGIELPGLVVANDVSSGSLQTTVSKTLSGRRVEWNQPANGGPLDLVGGSDYGWLTRSVLQSLGTLAAVAGATYTLTFSDSTTATVCFRNEDSAIDATPIVPRPNPAATDIYNNITIKLWRL